MGLSRVCLPETRTFFMPSCPTPSHLQRHRKRRLAPHQRKAAGWALSLKTALRVSCKSSRAREACESWIMGDQAKGWSRDWTAGQLSKGFCHRTTLERQITGMVSAGLVEVVSLGCHGTRKAAVFKFTRLVPSFSASQSAKCASPGSSLRSEPNPSDWMAPHTPAPPPSAPVPGPVAPLAEHEKITGEQAAILSLLLQVPAMSRAGARLGAKVSRVDLAGVKKLLEDLEDLRAAGQVRDVPAAVIGALKRGARGVTSWGRQAGRLRGAQVRGKVSSETSGTVDDALRELQALRSRRPLPESPGYLGYLDMENAVIRKAVELEERHLPGLEDRRGRLGAELEQSGLRPGSLAWNRAWSSRWRREVLGDRLGS